MRSVFNLVLLLAAIATYSAVPSPFPTCEKYLSMLTADDSGAVPTGMKTLNGQHKIAPGLKLTLSYSNRPDSIQYTDRYSALPKFMRNLGNRLKRNAARDNAEWGAIVIVYKDGKHKTWQYSSREGTAILPQDRNKAYREGGFWIQTLSRGNEIAQVIDIHVHPDPAKVMPESADDALIAMSDNDFDGYQEMRKHLDEWGARRVPLRGIVLPGTAPLDDIYFYTDILPTPEINSE